MLNGIRWRAVIYGYYWIFFVLYPSAARFHIPLIFWLLFGALISPTDPVAVLGILQEAKIPPDLEIKIAGGSLFNDGIGVVVYLSILEIATKGVDSFSASQIGCFSGGKPVAVSCGDYFLDMQVFYCCVQSIIIRSKCL